MVSQGIGCLLKVAGRLLSFRGVRGNKIRLDLGGYSVGRLMDSIRDRFADPTRLGNVSIVLSLPRNRVFTSISHRGIYGVVIGLVNGTMGCTRDHVSVGLISSSRNFQISIDSSNPNVPSIRGQGMFRTFCRIGSKGSKTMNANVNLTFSGSLTRTRRNALDLRSDMCNKSSFILALP